MSLETILAALAALIAPLTDIGQVYAHDRIAVEPEQVRSVFGVDDANSSKGWSVRAWMLDRASTQEQRLTNLETQRRHTLRLTGYWEVNDPGGSRVLFRTMTELVADTLRATFDLVPDAELVEPPQVDHDGLTVLGETYLVHSVELTTIVQELTAP